MTYEPSHEPPPGAPDPPPSPPPYAPLQEALTRVVAGRSWWRRWTSAGGRRGAFPVMAAIGAVLILSMLGIAAPWDADPDPARGDGTAGEGPALLPPSASPAGPPSLSSRSEPGEAAPEQPGGDSCPRPLTVVASPDIAGLAGELAGAFTGGSCPQATVSAEEPASTLARLADGGGAPDVWIPASSLWLRQATTGAGEDLPTSGTSIARTPIVVAVPQPISDSLNGFPVWMLIYNELTGEDGAIDRASMPDHRTTVGALAQISLQEALLSNAEGNQDGAFLTLVNFRDHLATTDADVAALLGGLANASAAQAREIGVFPATEQQLVAYHQRDPAMPVVPMGTYDANIHADYPMAVSGALDDRLAGIADELLAQLRSPEAQQRLVSAGFRPPMDQSPGVPEEISEFPDGYRDPFPDDYPEPVALPDQAGWGQVVESWTWQG